MICAVIDTQLLLRATAKHGTLSDKVVFQSSHLYCLIFSEETYLEIVEILHRPSVVKKFPVLEDELTVNRTLNRVSSGNRVALPYPIPKIVRDPKDDIFLATALAGQADYLVTEDQDLLVIKRYHDTQIVDLPTFWNVLQSLT